MKKHQDETKDITKDFSFPRIDCGSFGWHSQMALPFVAKFRNRFQAEPENSYGKAPFSLFRFFWANKRNERLKITTSVSARTSYRGYRNNTALLQFPNNGAALAGGLPVGALYIIGTTGAAISDPAAIAMVMS